MTLIFCRCYLSEGSLQTTGVGDTFFLLKWQTHFPCFRFSLEVVTLPCSQVFSSAPDRLHCMWLILPLWCHIKVIKIKLEFGSFSSFFFFNAQNTVFKGLSEIIWKYPSLCRKLYIIIAYYCQSMPATVCYSAPVYFWVRRQWFFIETLILKHPGSLNLCRLQVQQNFDHILLLGLFPSALHFEQSSLSKCLQFPWIYP